jgi:hypothetical protein
MSDLQTVISEAVKSANGGNQATSVAGVVQAAIPTLTPSFSDSVSTIARQLELLQSVTVQQLEVVAENTQAVAQNTGVQKSGGAAAVAGSIATTALKTLGGGLTLLPLVSTIVGLFKGSKTEDLPILPTYTPPPAVNFAGAAPPQGGQPILAVDYGQDGRPRTMPATAPFFAPSVTVQVQAMDSRSFLDHSDDIAQAVREAILNAHSLSDVVNEL